MGRPNGQTPVLFFCGDRRSVVALFVTLRRERQAGNGVPIEDEAHGYPQVDGGLDRRCFGPSENHASVIFSAHVLESRGTLAAFSPVG